MVVPALLGVLAVLAEPNMLAPVLKVAEGAPKVGAIECGSALPR
jgi:hypothetical protein